MLSVVWYVVVQLTVTGDNVGWTGSMGRLAHTAVCVCQYSYWWR